MAIAALHSLTMAFLHALLHFDEYLAAGQHGPAVYLVLVTIVFCETALLALFFLPGTRCCS